MNVAVLSVISDAAVPVMVPEDTCGPDRSVHPVRALSKVPLTISSDSFSWIFPKSIVICAPTGPTLSGVNVATGDPSIVHVPERSAVVEKSSRTFSTTTVELVTSVITPRPMPLEIWRSTSVSRKVAVPAVPVMPRPVTALKVNAVAGTIPAS